MKFHKDITDNLLENRDQNHLSGEADKRNT